MSKAGDGTEPGGRGATESEQAARARIATAAARPYRVMRCIVHLLRCREGQRLFGTRAKVAPVSGARDRSNLRILSVFLTRSVTAAPPGCRKPCVAGRDRRRVHAPVPGRAFPTAARACFYEDQQLERGSVGGGGSVGWASDQAFETSKRTVNAVIHRSVFFRADPRSRLLTFSSEGAGPSGCDALPRRSHPLSPASARYAAPRNAAPRATIT